MLKEIGKFECLCVCGGGGGIINLQLCLDINDFLNFNQKAMVFYTHISNSY